MFCLCVYSWWSSLETLMNWLLRMSWSLCVKLFSGLNTCVPWWLAVCLMSFPPSRPWSESSWGEVLCVCYEVSFVMCDFFILQLSLEKYSKLGKHMWPPKKYIGGNPILGGWVDLGKMTLSLPKVRWAALLTRCAIVLLVNCEGKSHKIVLMNYNFWIEESVKQHLILGPSACLLSALLHSQTGLYWAICHEKLFKVRWWDWFSGTGWGMMWIVKSYHLVLWMFNPLIGGHLLVRIHRAALWILGEYCTTADDIQNVMTLIRQSLGEVGKTLVDWLVWTQGLLVSILSHWNVCVANTHKQAHPAWWYYSEQTDTSCFEVG